MKSWILTAVGLAVAMGACGDDGADKTQRDAAATLPATDAGANANDASSLDANVSPDAQAQTPDSSVVIAGDASTYDAGSADRIDAAGPKLDAAASDSGNSSDARQGESFAALYADIFSPVCKGCHQGGAQQSQLDMSTAELTYANLVGVRARGSQCLSETVERIRVVPGNAESSLLVDKLEPDPSCGSRMPLSSNGPFLSESNITRIRRWIAQGAANN